MGYFPAKSAVSQPTCQVKDTNWRRILAKSVSDEWSPETLHGGVSRMAATLLSLKGHVVDPSLPIEKKSPLQRKNRMVQPDALNVGYERERKPSMKSLYSSLVALVGFVVFAAVALADPGTTWAKPIDGKGRFEVLSQLDGAAVFDKETGPRKPPSRSAHVAAAGAPCAPPASLTCTELVALGYAYPYAREVGPYLFVDGAAYPYADLSPGLFGRAQVKTGASPIAVADLLETLGL